MFKYQLKSTLSSWEKNEELEKKETFVKDYDKQKRIALK